MTPAKPAKPLSLMLTVLVHAALLANQAILAVHVLVMKWLTTPHTRGSPELVALNASAPLMMAGAGSPLLPQPPAYLPAGVEAGIHPNIVCSTRCLLATPLLIVLAVRQQRLSAARSVIGNPRGVCVPAPARDAVACHAGVLSWPGLGSQRHSAWHTLCHLGGGHACARQL